VCDVRMVVPGPLWRRDSRHLW